MSEVLDILQDTAQTQARVCPVCDRFAEELFAMSSIPERLASIIIPNAAAANANQVCARCLQLFGRGQWPTRRRFLSRDRFGREPGAGESRPHGSNQRSANSKRPGVGA